MKIRKPLLPIVELGNVPSGKPFVFCDRPDLGNTMFMRLVPEENLLTRFDRKHFTVVNLETGDLREFNTQVFVQTVGGRYILKEGD